MSRIQLLWAKLSGTLWFVPAVMTAAAVALSAATILLDSWLIATSRASEMWFVFGVGSEGVRGVLSAVAGGIITVTGVVFSITVVALQLASTQFTPRVLRTFIEDRATQLVLGTFIGTFTYPLLILRFVRSKSDDLGAFVPSISVTVAMVLALVSVGALIYFINHIAQSITASAVIDRLTREAIRTARNAFPREIGEPATASRPPEVVIPAHEPLGVRVDRSGYLQAVREEALLALADFGPLVVRMEGRVGQFYNSGDVIASVWLQVGRRDAGEQVSRKVRAAFAFGAERTALQDVELGISRLVDVAVKALSPGVNDPTTAVMCIDGISEVLVVLGTRETPEAARKADGGQVVLLARRPEFDDLVDVAFTQIRHYGARDPVVALKLVHTIGRIADRTPASRRAALARHLEHVAGTAVGQIEDETDRDRVRRAARRVLAEVAVPA